MLNECLSILLDPHDPGSLFLYRQSQSWDRIASTLVIIRSTMVVVILSMPMKSFLTLCVVDVRGGRFLVVPPRCHLS